MFTLRFSKRFKRNARKYGQKNQEFIEIIDDTLDRLRIDPGDPVLRSHRVTSRDAGVCWSSRVTGDIRILWDYTQFKDTLGTAIIEILDIGSHSGSKKVYKN
ncbi:MAG TPA: hypothetical protein VJL83_04270 [Patescibacteria group bacterium]|nr:hypothetical protein [Patescibacteria group bacterium]